jgi:hypothetical protein
MAKSPKDKPKLTISAAAEYLSEPVWKVKQWRRHGRFPNAELLDTPRGPVWQIPQTDLDNFMPPKVGRRPKVEALPK